MRGLRTNNTLKRNQGGKYRLKRDFKCAGANQKWVTDITQFRTLQGIVYASAIKDLHDGYIVGCVAGKDSTTQLVINTISLARTLLSGNSGMTTILHSDQGTQYTSSRYKEYIDELPIEASMSRPGNPIDNSSMESFFSSLKSEWLRDTEKMSADTVICEIQD